MGKIKKPTPKQGSLVKSIEPINTDKLPPIFSLEKIQSGKYCLSQLNEKNKAMFSDAIYRRKATPWSEIKQQHRHGLGAEKISKSSIKAAIPKFITEDVSDFLVFRYNGMHPMVGYRQREIFYVLWFDHDFTLYDH
ncbi:MAG: hypothetical protein ABNH15_05765 [Alcanivorax sp.]|jgi:hypothetical protein